MIGEMAMYVDVDEMEHADAAARWISENEATWSPWLHDSGYDNQSVIDNLTATRTAIIFDSVKLSFNDLSYVNGLKPDNQTYLCGISDWQTGVAQEISGCQFKDGGEPESGYSFKALMAVTDNGTLRINGDNSSADSEGFPSQMTGCEVYGPESEGVYLYPLCESQSSSSSTPGITVNVISDNTTEAGGTASFTVVLDSEPTASVNIPISSDNVSEGTVSTSALTFYTSNWNAAQTVTVTGVDDSVVDDNATYNIVIGAATSSDTNYNGMDAGDVVMVNANDDIIPEWAGTQQLGTSSTDYGNGVTVDSSDNIYVTGQTQGGLDGNTSSGNWDLFLVKYNSSGVKQWTQQLGTSSYDKGDGVTVDSSGNIYVTGYTAGGLDGNTSSGDADLFLVKYNSSGVKQWTQQLGTSSSDQGNGVTVDSSNNIYVTGSTTGGLDGNTSSGSQDIFLVKYNSSGTKQWTKQLGTSSEDVGTGVTVDSSNNVYVSGYTAGGLDGNTNSGSNDLILVKYNSSGTKQWTKQLGTSSNDKGEGVTVDSSNNVYVSGYTDGGLDGNTSSGGSDLILVKYNSSGVKQ
jgi:hypothetical protein